MKAKISFEDRGARSVLMESEIEFSEQEESYDKPTPAAVLALATKAMFENGMLARAGAVALEGISEGKAPSDCILAAFTEKKRNDTNER